jgi:hypothetical protein
MAHPKGGSGNRSNPKHTFAEAYEFVGVGGAFTFQSTTGESITAKQGTTRDGKTPTIVFYGKTTRHGSACEACWGCRSDCDGSWIGHCTEALDSLIRWGS